MKLKLAFAAALTCTALLPTVSEAAGCLKGAAVGGVGGHFAGHHGLIGAAAGCAVGHHMASKKQRAATNVVPAPTATTPPATTAAPATPTSSKP